EVTQLATRFGIVTPYTSYLVVEQGAVTTPPPPRDGPRDEFRPRPMPVTRGGFEADDEASGWGIGGAAPASEAAPMAPKKAVEEKSRRARESLKADGGKDGVAAAKEIGKLKGSSTTSSRAVTTVQNAMGRSFTFGGGAFVDSAIKGGEKTLTVQAYSDAWF